MAVYICGVLTSCVSIDPYTYVYVWMSSGYASTIMRYYFGMLWLFFSQTPDRVFRIVVTELLVVSSY